MLMADSPIVFIYLVRGELCRNCSKISYFFDTDFK
jgi:hypothetical protein